MKSLLIYTVLFLTSLSMNGQKTLDALLKVYNTNSVPYISVQELRMLQLNENVQILDAREIEEFEISHIPTAMYVGFSKFSSEGVSEAIIEKDKPIIVYCSLGIRSEEIGEKLLKAGYTNVKNLYGGIFEWKNNGFPVLDLAKAETEDVHVCSKLWGKWLTKGNKIYE